MADSNKVKILIIDDTADFREIFTIKLAAADFEVADASGGEEGIEKIKKWKPDLVLLDMEMPGFNGIETLMKIKSIPEIQDSKVVFVTSYGEPQEKLAWTDKKFAEEIGAMDYIRKTDDFDKIISQIKKYVTQPSTHTSS